MIGEIFFGRMFGLLEKSQDHGDYIASLDACMPMLCISAVGPTYLRPLVTASSIVSPAVSKAIMALDSLRKTAIVATGIRNQRKGGERHDDMLGQLLDIADRKDSGANFGISEVTLEAYTAM